MAESNDRDMSPIEGLSDGAPSHDPLVPPTSRRTFLGVVAGVAAATTLEGPAETWAGFDPEVGPIGQRFTLRLTRASDMVDLTLQLRNITIAEPKPGSRVLAKDVGAQRAYMIAEFWPQHVAEEALFMAGEQVDADTGTTTATGEIAPVDPSVHAPYGTGTVFASPATFQWHRALPLRSRFAGPSRLVFEIDFTRGQPIPYTVPGLLDWANPRFVPTLVPAAELGQKYVLGVPTPLVEPDAWETSIEFPYGVVLTPTPAGRWGGRTRPFTVGNRTEVWASGLAESEREPGFGGAPMRAVWTTSPAFSALSGPEPTVPPTASSNPGFLVLPTSNDKWQLVRKTTDRPLVHRVRPAAPVLRARTFRMSALGATVDLSGDFTATDGLALEAYVHRAFAGRDVYVKVVSGGYLYPTGHKASQVTVTERVFAAPTGQGVGTGTVAYLQEYTFLIVRQPVKTYVSDPTQESIADRAFPFRKVTIDLRESPPMAPTALPTADGAAIPNGVAFLPMVDGDCFRWPCTVIDKSGVTHQVAIPLAFVSQNYPGPEASPDPDWSILRGCYEAVDEVMRSIDTRGLRIAFARDDLSGMVGKTKFPTLRVVMTGMPDIDLKQPSMGHAVISLEALDGLLPDPSFYAFRFPDVYLQLGFAGVNAKGAVFGEFVEVPGLGALDIEFPDVAKLGGLIKPDFSLTGLSAVLGSFGGSFNPSALGFALPDVLDGDGGFAFDPANWFSGLPTILGGIELTDILDSLPSIASINPRRPVIPGLTTTIIEETVAGRKVPVGLKVEYRWCTSDLKSAPGGDGSSDNVFLTTQSSSWLGAAPSPSHRTELCIEASYLVRLGVPSVAATPSVAADAEVKAELRDFQVSLFGSDTYRFVVLDFRALTFVSRSGTSPKVSPDISGVEFAGALSFVKDLAKKFAPEGGLLGGAGGGAGGLSFDPIFDVDSQHVEVGFVLGLPSINVGAFSLANLEFGMLVNLPFDAQPMMARFHVCRQDRPFMLSVGFLGGGGFFALEVGLDGVRMLEVALEFGANLQVNLGVASGGVSVMAGIHFMVTSSPDSVELTGYLRMNGRLEIIGLITMSAEFLLSLSYISPPGVAKGRAEVSFTVEVAFFSTTVSAQCERTFGGNESGGGVRAGDASTLALPPVLTTSDFMSGPEWSAYVGAFASA